MFYANGLANILPPLGAEAGVEAAAAYYGAGVEATGAGSATGSGYAGSALGVGASPAS